MNKILRSLILQLVLLFILNKECWVVISLAPVSTHYIKANLFMYDKILVQKGSPHGRKLLIPVQQISKHS